MTLLAPMAEMVPLVDRYGQGLFDHVPGDDYYRRVLGEANKGALDVVARSLYHYKHWAGDTLADVIESRTFLFGRAFHCLLLEPHRYATDFVILPDIGNRSRADRLAHERFADLNAGKGMVTRKQDATIRAMVQAIRRHPLADMLLPAGAINERTLCWRDPDTDLPCKSRLDFYSEEHAYVVDPKSCEDASFEAFARSVTSYRYHVQDAHYRAGCQVVGKPIKHFFFLCIEKAPPHAVAVYLLDAPALERGWELRQRDMARLATGVRENRWPSYNNDKTAELRLPAYAFYGD